MTPILQPLAQANETQQFGGKGSGLAWLIAQDCTVPDGCVLPVSAFDKHLEQSGLTDFVQNLASSLGETSPLDDAQLQSASAKLQLTIKQLPLEKNLSKSLKTLWENHQLDNPNTVLAVRSSALSEDGQRASFAGQYDSVLHVNSADALVSSIKQVWASAFNVHALRYGQHHKQPMSRMAVVIQQQIDAAVSGVLFTQNPTENAPRCMLLECCNGLADGLVSGDITPASAQVDRGTLEVSDHQESSDASIDFSQHKTVLKRLSKQALLLEQITGKALDIEWCVDKNEKLFFVQCRS